MNKYDVMYNSIEKNIQEFCEFAADWCDAKNYYDLVDKMTILHKFYVEIYTKDKKMTEKLIKKIVKEMRA